MTPLSSNIYLYLPLKMRRVFNAEVNKNKCNILESLRKIHETSAREGNL